MVAMAMGVPTIIAGLASIAFLFALYSRYQDPGLLVPESMDSIMRMAGAFYILLVAAFGAISFGMYTYHKERARAGGGLLGTIAKTTWNMKSRRVWAVTFVVYGLFFSMSSGTLVYQPDISFSYHYNIKVPSVEIAPCCDAPGYMPVILAYVTDHVGLQIIPINTVLQVVVSYLVSLNMALAVAAINISRKKRSLGTLGATTGLFIACPTCAGTFLSFFVGTASGIAAVAVLAQLQTLFIGISIPILLAVPFIIARKMHGTQCETVS